MGLFDSIQVGNSQANPTPSAGGLFSGIKVGTSQPTGNGTPSGLFSNIKVPTRAPTPTTSPYFATTTKSGASFGPSLTLDPSGRPLLDYRKPGDTSTTTDKTRVDTTFDPTIAAPHIQSDIATPRTVSPQLKADIKAKVGAPSSDVIDHAMALTVAGSNMPENLRPETNDLNSAQGTFEGSLDEQVRDGKISLFDAQKLEAANKGLPEPYTGAQPQSFWDNVKSYLNDAVNNTKAFLGQTAHAETVDDSAPENKVNTDDEQFSTAQNVNPSNKSVLNFSAIPNGKALPSAPQTTSKSTPTTSDGYDTGKILNYLFNPKGSIGAPSPVYNAFATPQEKADQANKIGPLYGPRIITGPAKIINDTIVGTPAWAADAVVRVSEATRTIFGGLSSGLQGKGFDFQEATTKLPFDPSRIGLPDSDNGKTDTPLLADTTKRLAELDQANPKTPTLNLLQAFGEKILPPVLGTIFVGSETGALASEMSRLTGSSPALGISSQAIRDLSPSDAAQEVIDKFYKQASDIYDSEGLGNGGLTKAGQSRMTQLIVETKALGQRYSEGTIPQLNTFGKILDNTATRLQQNIGNLGVDLGLTRGKVNPSDQTLPGYRARPGQAPAFGLSTEEVEPVGFGDQNPQKTKLDIANVKSQVGGNNTIGQGAEYDKMIAEGDVKAEDVYSNPETKIFQPDRAKQMVSDVAANLDEYKSGLGDSFKNSVDINNTSAAEIREKALNVLEIKTPSTPEIAAKQYYNAKISPNIAAGQATIIGADDLKDYYGKDYNDKNHPIYSKAAFDLYQQALKENPDPTVRLTGGGPGSGKTELINNNISKDFKGTIYDSNLSNYDGAVKQIQAARDAGKNVEIYGILPNLETARGFTLSREAQTGRGITDKTFARGHSGFPATVKKLLDNSIIKPEDVHLLDTRAIKDNKDTFLKMTTQGVFAKDPVALLNKIGYNEENVRNIAQTIREKFQQPTREQSGFSHGSSRSSSQNRSTIRSESNTERGSASIGPKTNKPVLQENLSNLQNELEVLQHVVDSNPAKALSKYTNKYGELAEVLGNRIGKFADIGDQISQEHGFVDSESARLEYANYRLQQKRLANMKRDYANLKKIVSEGKLEDKDAKSLRFFLNKNADITETEIKKIASKNKPTEIQKKLQARRVVADAHLNRVLEAVKKVQPTMQVESPDMLSQITKEAYNIPLSDFEKIGEGDPLNKIVIDTSTNVKDKVGILDYLRTPDRVLKKIGLEGIGNLIRTAYENYLLELPLHLDVIRDWKSRVPADGSKRIFQWLDGQQNRDFHAGKTFTALEGEELRVAKEMKSYLAEWAERLGLPDDNKISHYITHIFNIDQVEKEFDEDLASIIRDKVPGSVYDPFLEKRLGRKGYIEDAFRATEAYVKRAVRKANMDPALEKLKSASKSYNTEDSQFLYLKRLGDRINLRPTEIDTLVDNTLKQLVGYRFGPRPTAVLTRTVRQWISRSMLGLNIGSAVKNLTQGVNTFAKLGPKYTALGYMQLFTKMNDIELEESGILKQDIIQDKVQSAARATLEKFDKGLFFMFETAEKINRGAAYFGAKAKALAQGLSEDEAKNYAKKLVRDTQFQFGSIDTPVGLSSDLSKTFTQFMSFGIKNTEFVAEMAKNKEWGGLLRYILASLLISATIGKALNIKWTDFVPGYSIISRFGLPPAFSLPLAIIKAVFSTPDQYGQVPTLTKKLENIGTAIPFPASIQAVKTYKGISAVNTPANNIPQTPLNYARAATFGASSVTSPAIPSPFTASAKNISAQKKADMARIQPTYDRVQQLITDGRTADAAAITSAMSPADYAIYKEIKTANKAAATQKGEADMVPIVQQVQTLLQQGKTADAQKITTAMTPVEYKFYVAAKKRLGIK